MSRVWASRESCGVYRDFDDKLWFYWSVSNKWSDLLDVPKMDDGDDWYYIGQVKDIVDNLTSRLNQYGDMIDDEDHLSFLKEYESKVQNPEIVSLFRKECLLL